jgi:hypothetical protein
MSGFSFVSSLVAVDLIEDGAFCQFNHPETGEPLYLPGAQREDGSFDASKAVGAYVRSTSSQAYDAFKKTLTRTNFRSGRRAKSEVQRDEVLLSNMEKEDPAKLCVLITRFQNTSLQAPGLGVWTPSEEEKLVIVKDPHNKVHMDKCLVFADEIANYPSSEGAAPGA